MRRTTKIRVVCAAALLGLSSLGAFAEEGWTRFDNVPLVKGSLDGRTHIFSVAKEHEDGCRVLINGASILVVDPSELKVFGVPRKAVRKEQKGWSVGTAQLTPRPGAHMTMTALADDQVAYHIWWPGHEMRLELAAPPPRLGSEPAAAAPPPRPGLEPAAGDQPLVEPPHPAAAPSSPSSMEPLALGLRWKTAAPVGEVASHVVRKVSPPVVTRVPVPAKLLLRFQPLGKAYRVELQPESADIPIVVEIPVPPRAFAGSKRIALLRSEKGGFSVVTALGSDRTRHVVTVGMDRSSTWIPTLWQPGYPGADLWGTIKVRPDCEETPRELSFDVTRSDDGQYVNFPVVMTGPGSYRLETPIPQSEFGSYVFHSLKGVSAHFLFGQLTPDPVQEIVERKSYVQDMVLVPVSGRLEGLVVSPAGEPLAGARISLLQAGDTLSVTTDSGGRFILDRIVVEPASDDPARIYTVRYRIERQGMGCRRVEGALALRAGVTTHETLVFDCMNSVRAKGLAMDRGSSARTFDTAGQSAKQHGVGRRVLHRTDSSGQRSCAPQHGEVRGAGEQDLPRVARATFLAPRWKRLGERR